MLVQGKHWKKRDCSSNVKRGKGKKIMQLIYSEEKTNRNIFLL